MKCPSCGRECGDYFPEGSEITVTWNRNEMIAQKLDFFDIEIRYFMEVALWRIPSDFSADTAIFDIMQWSLS